MFARVTHGEGDPAWIDESATWLRETVMPMGRDELEGFRGVLLVADRSIGRGRTITFWDSEEALQASEQRAAELRDEGSTTLGFSVIGVEHYEVAVDEPIAKPAEGAAYARITIGHGDPAQTDESALYLREKVVPDIRRIPGNRGVLSLMDRATGNGLSLTFWESEEALRASEEVANQVRSGAAAAIAMEVLGVDRCEVVLDERF